MVDMPISQGLLPNANIPPQAKGIPPQRDALGIGEESLGSLDLRTLRFKKLSVLSDKF